MGKQRQVEVYNQSGKLISYCTVKRAAKMVGRKKAEWIGHNQVLLLITDREEKQIRREVRERDQDVCLYCGRSLEEHEITYDHVTPRTRGGEDSVENLAVACAPCNEDKANLNYEEYFLLLAQRIELLRKGYLVTLK